MTEQEKWVAASRKDWEEMVRGPGKFEGEAPYVPYFWDLYLNGFADDDDGVVLSFTVDEEDKAIFPELRRRKRVKLYESSNGFVIEVR
jgi:hypothetical protein